MYKTHKFNQKKFFILWMCACVYYIIESIANSYVFRNGKNIA